MVEKFSRFDAAEYLNSEAEMAAYLAACAEEGDPDLILAALGDIARARSIGRIAREAEMSREGLYKALSGKGNPSFANVVKIARAVGFKVLISPSAQLEDPVRTKKANAPRPQAKNAAETEQPRARKQSKQRIVEEG